MGCLSCLRRLLSCETHSDHNQEIQEAHISAIRTSDSLQQPNTSLLDHEGFDRGRPRTAGKDTGHPPQLAPRSASKQLTTQEQNQRADPVHQESVRNSEPSANRDFDAASTFNEPVPIQNEPDADYDPPCHRFCELCRAILAQSQMLDDLARGTDPPAGSHESWSHYVGVIALLESVNQGCHLCTLLYVECCWDRHDWPDYLASGQLELLILQRPDKFTQICLGSSHPHASISRGLHVGSKQYRDGYRKPVDVPGTTELSGRTTSTSSAATFQLAREWLRSCRTQHNECNMQGCFPEGRPKRVLMLSGTSDRPVVRLLPTSSADENLEYLTLSHCWGKKQHLTLSKANCASFTKGLSFADLAQTFQDAVQITLRLGYCALWIDALCIIQDEPEDVQAEIPRMGIIYGNSVCTIAALTSRGSAEGCFSTRKPLAWKACRVRTKSGALFEFGGARTQVSERQLSLYGYRKLNDAPALHQRGWVVQERALSPRTLYFGNVGIHWACCVATMYEQDMHKFVNDDQRFGKGKVKAGLSSVLREYRPATEWREPRGDAGSYEELGTWHNQWWHLVSMYTRCRLTNTSDRQPAISGISAIFERAVAGNLVYGLWRNHLHRDLLWRAGFSMENEMRHRLNGSPTWSWLSVDGPVGLNNVGHTLHESQCAAEIVSLSRRESASKTFSTSASRPFEDYITIDTPMAKIPRGGHRGVAGYDAFSSDGQDSVDARILLSGMLDFIAGGNWTADVPLVEDGTEERQWGRQWTEAKQLWALQWTKGVDNVSMLIVQPICEDRSKWQRVGIFNRVHRQRSGHAVDRDVSKVWSRMTINLY